LARALGTKEQKDRRQDLLKQPLAVQPHHPQALAETARLNLDESKFDLAEKALQKALQADPSDRANQYVLFQCLERAGKKEAARQQQRRLKTLESDLARLEEIVRHDLPKNPRSADLYVELGVIFARHGKSERALASYQQALTYEPNHSAAKQEMSNVKGSMSNLPR